MNRVFQLKLIGGLSSVLARGNYRALSLEDCTLACFFFDFTIRN